VGGDGDGRITRALNVTNRVGECDVEVLGTVAAPSVAVDDGPLPTTGIDWLLLILWALLLIIVGNVIFFIERRRGGQR
jgi:hypothetical protein